MKSRRCVLFLLLLVALMVLPSCAAGPDPTFTTAARATHDAVMPEYLGYVERDTALDEAQRERRRRTVARWDEAIRAREGQK